MLRMPRRAPREGLAIIATPFTSSCKASVFGIICGLVADKKWKPHPHSEGRLVARGRMFVFLLGVSSRFGTASSCFLLSSDMLVTN